MQVSATPWTKRHLSVGQRSRDAARRGALAPFTSSRAGETSVRTGGTQGIRLCGGRITAIVAGGRRSERCRARGYEFVPEERLVMRTAEGPFTMETTYTWETVDGGTRMTLRNR